MVCNMRPQQYVTCTVVLTVLWILMRASFSIQILVKRALVTNTHHSGDETCCLNIKHNGVTDESIRLGFHRVDRRDVCRYSYIFPQKRNCFQRLIETFKNIFTMEEGKREEKTQEEKDDNEWGDWISNSGNVSSNCPSSSLIRTIVRF